MSDPIDPSSPVSTQDEVSSLNDGAAIDQFLAGQAPSWLKKASVEDIESLRASLVRHHSLQKQVSSLMQAVQPINSFAASLLSSALTEDLRVSIDVQSAYWRDVRLRVASPVFRVLENDIPTFHTYHLQTALLQKALQNFPENQTQSRYYYAGSGIILDDGTVYPSPERVAKLCRTLDIGAQYQKHLDDIFQPSDDDDRKKVLQLLADEKRCALNVQARCSFLKGEINEAACKMLLQVSMEDQDVKYNDCSVRFRSLYILGCRIQSALVVEARVEQLPGVIRYYDASKTRQVIVFLPGDPVKPLRQYFSWYGFSVELAHDLKSQAYRDYLCRLVKHDEQISFKAGLLSALERPTPKFDVSGQAHEFPVFDRLAELQIARVKADAAVWAVPTQQVDHTVQQQRLQALESAGLTLLGMAAAFVPVVGEVMQVMFIRQLLGEVYEGVEDWTHDQREEALEHFLGVVQNLAASAAIAMGSSALVKVLRRSRFVDGLVPVIRADGLRRLWDPDLRAYHSPIPVSGDVSERGLIESQDRHWLRLGAQTFEVEQSTESGRWGIVHPSRRNAYAPELEHNGERAWWLSGEHPLQWEGIAEMIARLAPQSEKLSALVREQIAVIADVTEEQLRGVLVECREVPPTLYETLERTQIDVQVTELFDQARRGLPPSDLNPGLFHYAQAMLHALPSEAFPGSSVVQRLVEGESTLKFELFEYVASQVNPLTDSYVELLRRDFAGLPVRNALALTQRASADELKYMSLRERIPLALAERARREVQKVRAVRALEGLYFHNVYNQDSVRLLFALLKRLPSWPAGLSFELRAGGVRGQVLERQLDLAETRETRILVRSRGRFDVFASNREGAEDTSTAALDIYEAISAGLNRAERWALGWAGSESAVSMRNAVIEHALAGRHDVAHLLGIQGERSFFHPVQRFPGGRLGYPLSGRGPAERWLLFRMVRTLYPGFSNTDIESFLQRLQETNSNVIGALLGYREEYRTLDTALTDWWRASSGVGRLRRRWVANKILRCWRRQTTQLEASGSGGIEYRLSISSHALAELTTFPQVDFSHVAELSLSGTGLSDAANGFLSCFRKLRRLNLKGNKFRSIPSALEGMTDLVELNLKGNELSLDSRGARVISSLRKLESLNLSGNSLNGFLSVNHLYRLRIVRLRSCGLREIPNGLLDRPFLEFADLRSNDIPEPGDALPARVRDLLLLGNSRFEGLGARAREFISSLQSNELIPSDEVLSFWLEQTPANERAGRRALWNQLAFEDNSYDFFEVLIRMIDSADFSYSRADIDGRVWRMLEAMRANAVLREDIFDLAAQPVRCTDSVANIFSMLEVRFMLHDACAGISESHKRMALLDFARRLFRLQEVENIARSEMEFRRAGGSEVDEVEVSLAYRVALKDELDLPGQPGHAHFTGLADVKKEQLDVALNLVRQAERSERLAVFISGMDFWTEYVRQEHRNVFESIEDEFWKRLDALVEQQEILPEGEYLDQISKLGVERDDALQAAVLRLTHTALLPTLSK